MKLQLTSDVFTRLANESAERNIIKLKSKQIAKSHRMDASDTESALITLKPPSPKLQRKQYTLRNRARKDQFASCNNHETYTAVLSDSIDPDNSQSILNNEERGKNREFFSGALGTDKGWQSSSRSREENHVR